jgi:hypothetical protein
MITRVIYKNNGIDFQQEDWDRLKKIAEGNPDESKVTMITSRPNIAATTIRLSQVILTSMSYHLFID